jgi:hypothetical protein
MKIAIGYCRVATRKQSTEVQEYHIREFAAARGIHVGDMIRETDSPAGPLSLLRRALDDVACGLFDVLIVEDLSRVGRLRNACGPTMLLACPGDDERWDDRRGWISGLDDTLDRAAKARRARGKCVNGFVYFARAVGTEMVKIGWARDVEKRLASLRTACPHDMAIEGCIPGHMQDEKRVHAALASRREKREWFKLSSEEVASIISDAMRECA